jgi:hypothetical protein
MFYSYNLPIYASENDRAWQDADETAAVNELQRHHYLNDKMDAVGESLAAGTDIRGYSSGARSLTTVHSSNVVTMNAVNLNDTAAKSTRCYPVPSGLCNLRSAWAACELIPKSSQCVISLPSHGTLLWNSSLGALILDDKSNILIEGHSTEIIRTGFETRNSPPRYSGPEIFTADFPFDTHRLSDTATATKNYAQGCLQLCENDYVKLSSCNEESVGDTTFRLFDENNLEVSFNDDYCIAGAQLVYKKESIGCSEFCLHVGFTDESSCNAYVQLFNLTVGEGVGSDVSVASPRFIEYENITTSSIPTLTVRNLLLRNFGDFGFVNIDAGSDGGSVMMIGDCFATFERVVFNSSLGNYGGAMHFDANALGFVHIDRCLFYNNSACGGGEIQIFHVNGFALTNSVFLHCHTKQFGGAVSVDGPAEHAIISNATFYHCISRNAGAIDAFSDFITIIDSTFEGCRALGGFGSGGLAGAVRMLGCNYARIIRNVFRDCSSIAVAGAITMKDNNNLEITSCVFENCASVSGGCIYAISGHQNLTISNTTFSGCVASAYGGAIYFGNDNHQVSIEDTSIVDSSATIGGGLYLDTDNHHFTLKNVSIIGCTAKQVGGGIALDAENVHFHLVHSRVERCSAQTYGGGINIGTANSDLNLLRCNLSVNRAKYGGALASNEHNVGLTIAGSIVSRNTAEKSGGGVYLVTGHSQFAVIDAVGYQKTVVVESEHPYKSAYASVGHKVHVIYSKTVIVAGATGFAVNLDAATDIAFTDILAIYSDSSKSKLLYTSNTTATATLGIKSNLDYPGSTTPSLRVANSSFYVEFIQNPASIFPATAYADNHYGFKLYAYPILGKPQWPSVFEYNRASSGGAIFMYYENLFPALINTIISDNMATETGGGVMLRNSNKGAAFQNVLFARNSGGSDGGALVLSLAQYGNTFYNCKFDSNSAFGEGGAVSLFSDNGNALPRGSGILLRNNEIAFVKVSFFNNSASSGGAIMAGTTNVLLFSSCNFTQNHATSNGGAVALETTNTLSLNQCNIAANVAALCGAGIYSANLNSIIVESSSFRENSGGSGAAMCVRSGTSVAFEKACIMSRNSAELGGGAISSFDSPLWSMTSTARLTLSNNTASVGSALYFSGLQSSNDTLQKTRFTNNVASVGGTVFWLKDSSMVAEPPGLHHTSVVWANNHAPYGAKTATQALEIIGNSSISFSLIDNSNSVSDYQVLLNIM